MIAYLRNLLLYSHSNFLILIQFIMERFPSETLQVNVWANDLNEIIHSKYKKRPSKSERLQTIKQNNELLIKAIKAILLKAQQERAKKDD